MADAGQREGEPGKGRLKRVACGCLAAAAVVLFLVCGGVVSFSAWRLHRLGRWADAMERNGEDIQGRGEVGPLHEEARRLHPFEAARAPAITEERIEAFLEVRRGLRPRVAANADLFRRTRVDDGRDLELDEWVAVLDAWAALQREHARLLVEHGMSPEEYFYIAALVDGVLGVERPPRLAVIEARGDEARLVRARAEEFGGSEWAVADDFLADHDPGRFRPEEFRPSSGGGGWDFD